MKHLIMIAIGGAGGALCRVGLSNLINSLMHNRMDDGHFPYGTLLVNVLGSFFIGIIYVLIAERMTLHPDCANGVHVQSKMPHVWWCADSCSFNQDGWRIALLSLFTSQITWK